MARHLAPCTRPPTHTHTHTHPPTPATGKLIHDLLCDGRVPGRLQRLDGDGGVGPPVGRFLVDGTWRRQHDNVAELREPLIKLCHVHSRARRALDVSLGRGLYVLLGGAPVGLARIGIGLGTSIVGVGAGSLPSRSKMKTAPVISVGANSISASIVYLINRPHCKLGLVLRQKGHALADD